MSKNLIEQLLDIDAKKVKLPEKDFEMYCKKIGKKLTFHIKALDPERAAEINQNSIKLNGSNIEGVDIYNKQIFTILAGCEQLNDKELRKHFGTPTPKELIKTLFVAGEIEALFTEIEKLSEKTDIKENEIKN